MNGLNHNALTCSAVPIPPWERPLQTVEAQPYFNVSQASLVLEGIVFDRNNNLLFVDVATGRVFKLTPERQLSIVLKENSFGASGLAVHKDGRIFIASVGDMQRGSVRAIEPNGTREQMIVAPDAGFLVNDPGDPPRASRVVYCRQQRDRTWWRDDFSIGRIRAGTVSLFTSVTGNVWSGRPGNAGPGQGVNSSGTLKAA